MDALLVALYVLTVVPVAVARRALRRSVFSAPRSGTYWRERPPSATRTSDLERMY